MPKTVKARTRAKTKAVPAAEKAREVQLQIRITPTILNRLKRVAKQQNRSMSQVARMMLDEATRAAAAYAGGRSEVVRAVEYPAAERPAWGHAGGVNRANAPDDADPPLREDDFERSPPAEVVPVVQFDTGAAKD